MTETEANAPTGPTKIFSDWLRLLDGPKNKVFSEIVKQEDWARLFKVLLLVLVLSGTIFGTRLTIQALQKAPLAAVLDSPLAMSFIVVGSMLAVAYSAIARLFGIRLSLPKSFFIILSLLLPWVPIANFIDAIQTLPSFKFIGVLFLLAPLLLLRPIFNFYRGVLLITRATRWRVSLSVLLPMTVFTFLVFYMFG